MKNIRKIIKEFNLFSRDLVQFHFLLLMYQLLENYLVIILYYLFLELELKFDS